MSALGCVQNFSQLPSNLLFSSTGNKAPSEGVPHGLTQTSVRWLRSETRREEKRRSEEQTPVQRKQQQVWSGRSGDRWLTSLHIHQSGFCSFFLFWHFRKPQRDFCGLHNDPELSLGNDRERCCATTCCRALVEAASLNFRLEKGWTGKKPSN